MKAKVVTVLHRSIFMHSGADLRTMTPHARTHAAADTATVADGGGMTRDLNASSDESMTSAIDVIDKYVTPIWYVVGVPGNLLAFVVWTQKKLRASSGCYLAALAFNDCIFLILQVSQLRSVRKIPNMAQIFLNRPTYSVTRLHV